MLADCLLLSDACQLRRLLSLSGCRAAVLVQILRMLVNVL